MVAARITFKQVFNYTLVLFLSYQIVKSYRRRILIYDMSGPQVTEYNRVCAEAPGKLILCGEHAVVAGKAAVALAVGRTTRVTVFCSDYESHHHGSGTNEGASVILSSVVFKNEHGSIHAGEADDDVVVRQEVILAQPDVSASWSESPLPPSDAPVFQQSCSSSTNESGPRSDVPTSVTRSRSRSSAPRSQENYAKENGNSKTANTSSTLQDGMSFAEPIIALLSKFLALQGEHSKWPSGSNGVVHIGITSTIPIGAGMGSSAALSAATVGSLAAFLDIRAAFSSESDKDSSELNKGWCNDWAFWLERGFHGKPSGVDNYIAVHGGAWRFQNDVRPGPPSLRQVHGDWPSFLIVLRIDPSTGQPAKRSAKTLVQNVLSFAEKHPEIAEPLYDDLHEATERIISAEPHDATGRYEAMCSTFSKAHDTLNALGVGHPFTDETVRRAQSLTHYWPAKQTGAGGGGMVLVAIPPYLFGCEKVVQVAKNLLGKPVESSGTDGDGDEEMAWVFQVEPSKSGLQLIT